MSKKVVLMILDGWGIGKNDNTNAIFKANTPFMDQTLEQYPNAQLLTHGKNVGLPDGQMGNSEVGHMNIGAGRVVYQDLVKINYSIEDQSFQQNKVLKAAFEYAKAKGKKVHFMGLVSEGGVHAHQSHLHALCDMAKSHKLKEVFIHAFMDGRDSDPTSGLKCIQRLEQHLTNSTGKIASIIGRYYAMDRDKRWERIKLAYDLLIHGKGESFSNPSEAIQASYDEEVTDEFMKPKVIVSESGEPVATIEQDDVVICFNYRTDRCRQLSTALTQEDFADQEMQQLDLHYVTFTRYDENFQNVHVVFEKDNLNNTLGEILSKNGKHQIRIAETEKYPHVTFFFSGGREEDFNGESRLMAPSPKVATYDLQPKMSANIITEKICPELEKAEADFVCLNFANPDMVGHTGDFSAVVKAVETTDQEAQKVVECGMKNGYSFIIIADHGNADFMINEDGTPNTAHTINPVPITIIDEDTEKINSGILADIAPTVLDLLNVEQPTEMTGKSLVIS